MHIWWRDESRFQGGGIPRQTERRHIRRTHTRRTSQALRRTTRTTGDANEPAAKRRQATQSPRGNRSTPAWPWPGRTELAAKLATGFDTSSRLAWSCVSRFILPKFVLNGGLWIQGVEFPGEFKILRANPTGIVGGKVDGQAIVHVQPLGVMSEGFRHDSGAGHKAESVHEIGKRKLTMKLPG